MLNIFSTIQRMFRGALPLLVSLAASPAFSQLPEPAPVHLAVDPSKTCQSIENFAASDAWSCQFVGLWPNAPKEAIADWLFSTDTFRDGRPKGIGLSLWRFNIGAGSSGQGDASGIKDEWRRAESFLETGGQYNWQRQAGQLWFLRAAKQRGVHQFLGFLNSPPVTMTRNGKAYATAGVCNIDSGHYEAMAAYITQVVRGIKASTGITFNYISPVNEPQWEWSDGGQEGCPYNNKEIGAVVKTLSHSLSDAGLSSRILVPEAGHIKYLLDGEDKPGKSHQADFFFAPSSPDYIGNLSNINRTIAAHSYFSTSPIQKGNDMRTAIAFHIDSLRRLQHPVKSLAYWQSEYCILGDNEGEIDGSRRDTGMDAALYMARVIHNDLVYAHASAWQWWLAISPYDYKDGLIYVDKNKSGGDYYASRKLWAFGNFSRFVRPGMQRIETQIPETDDANGLLVSAYKDAHRKRLIIVVINQGPGDRELALTGEMLSTPQLAIYTTSLRENLQKQMTSSASVKIKGKSISTLVGNYK